MARKPFNLRVRLILGGKKKIPRFQYPDRPMAKTLDPKNFPGFSRQNICSVNFINFFHSLSTFFSVCLCWNLISVKANMLFMSHFWTSGPNTSDVIWSWSRLLCNSFSQVWNKALVYLINSDILWKIFFWKNNFVSYRPIIKNLRKILETTIIFLSAL